LIYFKIGGSIFNMISNTNKCPVCNSPMEWVEGHQVDPTNGITVYCKNKDCRMQDWAHGKNEREAYDIFVQKLGKYCK